MPQYQMVWQDPDAFKDLVDLILYHIEGYRNNRAEKEKISWFFKQLIESFFSEPVDKASELDSYTSAEVHILLSESFNKKRISMPTATIAEVLELTKSEHAQDAEEDKSCEIPKKMKASRNRGTRV